VTPLASPVPQLFQEGSAPSSDDNRFLLSAIAFLRCKQLQNGASARIAHERKKNTGVAVLEVLANTVSWSRA
jgi:DNA-directed RNA polymerase subunit K/omega